MIRGYKLFGFKVSLRRLNLIIKFHETFGDLMTNIGAIEWLIACSTPSHYLNQWWIIASWTLRLKFNKIWITIRKFLLRKYEWRCSLQNGNHFIRRLQYIDIYPLLTQWRMVSDWRRKLGRIKVYNNIIFWKKRFLVPESSFVCLKLPVISVSAQNM